MIRDWWPGLLLVAACWSGLAQAQVPFPSKPVRFVVTSPPCGANDTLNRALGAKLSENSGQPVVIDNRPGASGFVAADVQMMLIGTPTGMPLAKSGKARALAVAGAKRTPVAPELPTIAEAGLPGYEISSWFGAVASSRTPARVIAKLNGEFVRALQSPDLRERLAPGGYEVVANTPEQFSSHMRAQSKRLARLIRETGVKPD